MLFVQEIYEIPQASPKPSIGLTCSKSCRLTTPPVDALSSHPSPGPSPAHRPRMRWTPELHERFVEAVNKLDGAESKYNNFCSTVMGFSPLSVRVLVL